MENYADNFYSVVKIATEWSQQDTLMPLEEEGGSQQLACKQLYRGHGMRGYFCRLRLTNCL